MAERALYNLYLWHKRNLCRGLDLRLVRHPTWIAKGAIKYARADLAAGIHRP